MEITGMSRMALSELMIAMEYHLMQREGFHTFFHNYLREAIQLRYLPAEQDQKAAHARLGTYFSTQDYGHRRRDEEPWQWSAAGDTDSLWKSFADPGMFMLFANEDQRYHFIAYLQSFERERSFALFASLHKAMQRDDEYDRRRWLAQIAREGAFFDAASEILTAIAEAALHTPLDDKTSLDFKREQAQLYAEKQEYKLALPLCEEIVSIIDAKQGRSAELFDALLDLSTVMHGLGDYAGAERFIRRAIEFSEVISESRRIDAMLNLAAIVLAQGKHDEAVRLFEQTLELSNKLLGKMHPASLHCSINLGAALIFAGRFADALKILEVALPTIRNTLGDKHAWYIACLTSIGRILTETGEYDRAERTILELIDKSTLSQGAESENTLRSRISLGHVYRLKGDLQKALPLFETSLPPLVDRLGMDHPYIIRTKERIAEMSSAFYEKT
jgi:tetratricopeptide (TPR) repeat protein